MKREMIEEIKDMEDNSRLEDEYNNFFGYTGGGWVKIDED